jgi:hypothetical protein
VGERGRVGGLLRETSYRLRFCGPQRAGDLVLRAEVERSAADWRNFVGRGGGFDLSALDQSEINLDCLREK